MMKNSHNKKSDRREFLGCLAAGAATFGLTAFGARVDSDAAARTAQDVSQLEGWFSTIKGKHKMVFDAVTANEGFSVIWSYTFMTTNNHTGTADDELTAMVVLRSKAIPLALDDRLWAKYKLGKMFKLVDYATNAAADRNLFWNPKEGEMPESGMSIKALQARGAMFCVCETALTMTSTQYAKSKGADPDEMKKEWIAGILPGIQLVPSGVWAVNRAQEHGCSYCSAG